MSDNPVRDVQIETAAMQAWESYNVQVKRTKGWWYAWDALTDDERAGWRVLVGDVLGAYNMASPEGAAQFVSMMRGQIEGRDDA